MKKIISILLTLTMLFTVACAAAEEINVISREDGSGARGAFIELFGIEQVRDIYMGEITDWSEVNE